MKKGNIAQLSQQLDSMIGELGLEKLSAEGPAGEAAGVVADPGTAQPAKQEADRSNIEPASEGSQSASNNSIVNDEVPSNTVEATPADASNAGAASSTENITTATMVGGDPKVEDGYGSRQQTLDAPATSHPADVNKDPEKYSADLRNSATLIDQEIEKLSATQPAEDSTAADRIAQLVLGTEKEASAEDKEQAVLSSVTDYLTGYTKSASIIAELTADSLDLLSKQAVDEGMIADPAMAEEAMGEEAMGEGVPAEELAAGAEGADAEGDEEAAALAEAAQMLAAELGVSPEEILEAAAEELVNEGGDMGGEEMPAEAMPAEAMGGEEDLGGPDELEDFAGEEEKMAAMNEELVALREQAEELTQLKEAQAKSADTAEMRSLMTDSVRSVLKELTDQKVGN